MSYVKSDTGPFAMIPEWLLFSEVSANAVRLFGILHRHEGPGGVHPGRQRLATLMHCSLDTVDRTISELVGAGAVMVEARFDESGDRTSNAYFLRMLPPGSRKSAATGTPRTAATGSRTRAAQTITLMNENPLNEREVADAPARISPIVKPTTVRALTEADVEDLAARYGEDVVQEAVAYWRNQKAFTVARDKPAFMTKQIEKRQANGSSDGAPRSNRQSRGRARQAFDPQYDFPTR